MTARLLEAVPIGGPATPHGPADAVARLRQALTALRDPGSTADLVDRIPRAAAALGFDRVVYARLVGTHWQPTTFAGAPPSDGRGWPVPLDRAQAEHPALRGEGPVVVDRTGPGGLLPWSWCPSYVAVAVVERGVVVGMIHAGRGDGRCPTPLDEELLSTVADAAGACFASVRAVDTVRELMAAVGRASVELDRPRCAPPTPLRLATVDGPPLSAREREVLELMAAGQTNGQIARRLVITEGTTKSHVKRIMRKLRAANRAEAVAAWMRPAERPTTVIERI